MPYTLGSLLHPADRAEVLSRLVHRFTGEHVPAWARKPAPNGRFYAPHYATDAEWLSSTVFRVRKSDRRLDERATSCESRNQTFPFGEWLDQPFTRAE